MSRVDLTMRSNRTLRTSCFGDVQEPAVIDVQDGQRVYELLDSAKDPGPDVWVEYRSSE